VKPRGRGKVIVAAAAAGTTDKRLTRLPKLADPTRIVGGTSAPATRIGVMPIEDSSAHCGPAILAVKREGGCRRVIGPAGMQHQPGDWQAR